MEKLKIGIIGAGRIGNVHAQSITYAIAEAEVAAVTDVKEEMARALAEKYGKRKMLLSGIHFNFSYPEYYLRELFDKSVEDDFTAFAERHYLDLAEKAVCGGGFILLVLLVFMSAILRFLRVSMSWNIDLAMLSQHYPIVRC